MYTGASGEMILQDLATEIAVKILSPVAIIVLILYLLSSAITSAETGFSWLFIIKRPKKVRLFSKWSLGSDYDFM